MDAAHVPVWAVFCPPGPGVARVPSSQDPGLASDPAIFWHRDDFDLSPE